MNAGPYEMEYSMNAVIENNEERCLGNDIERLDSSALAELVRRADLPHFGPEVAGRLPLYDRPTLVRLAHLARLCDRNRELVATE